MWQYITVDEKHFKLILCKKLGKEKNMRGKWLKERNRRKWYDGRE